MEKTIPRTDAHNQSEPVSDKARRDLVEDGKNHSGITQPDTSTEKEASYKHENGNPQAEIAADVRKHIQQKDTQVDDPQQELGSNS